MCSAEIVEESLTSPKSKRKIFWGDNDIQGLISLMRERYDDMTDPRSRKHFWTSLSEDLGIGVNAEQVKKKWYNLVSSYNNTKQGMGKMKFGHGPRLFRFFEEMDEILHNRTSSRPSFSSLYTIDVHLIDNVNEGQFIEEDAPEADELQTVEATQEEHVINTNESHEEELIQHEHAGNPNTKRNYKKIMKEYYVSKMNYLKRKASLEEEEMAIKRQKLDASKRIVALLENIANKHSLI